MKLKKSQIAGWVLSALMAAFLVIASATPKLIQPDSMKELLQKSGYTLDALFIIGIVEAALAILFLVPRAGFLAAILLTAYLGGATATHVRAGEPFFFPILFGVVIWVAYGLRRPEIFRLAVGAPISPIASKGE